VFVKKIAIAFLAAAVGIPAFAGFAGMQDWRPADRARFQNDMRAAASRVAEGVARQRRDAARARKEARLAAQELRNEARQFTAERSVRARQWRTEMKSSLREFKESFRNQALCWRNRNRI